MSYNRNIWQQIQLTNEGTRHILADDLPAFHVCALPGGQNTDARTVADTACVSRRCLSFSPFEGGLEARKRFCCDSCANSVVYRHHRAIQVDRQYLIREDS